MASLRLYGANSAATERMLASQGVQVEHDSSPDPAVLRRAMFHHQLDGIIDLDKLGIAGDPERLAEELARRPEALREPLVVRGNCFMVSRDPARLQSLMY